MLILAIEGALAHCSAALLRDGVVVASALHEGPRGQPFALPPMVAQILAQAGLAATALDALAVGIGPGGFTGLRTAIALAEGMAQALGKPLSGVTTGEALAADLPATSRTDQALWSVLDQRQGRVVLEIFQPGAAEPEAPVILPLESLPDAEGAVLLLGDAAPAAAAALAARGFQAQALAHALPSAAAVGRVAAQKLSGALPPRSAMPLYAEPPATTRPG